MALDPFAIALTNMVFRMSKRRKHISILSQRFLLNDRLVSFHSYPSTQAPHKSIHFFSCCNMQSCIATQRSRNLTFCTRVGGWCCRNVIIYLITYVLTIATTYNTFRLLSHFLLGQQATTCFLCILPSAYSLYSSSHSVCNGIDCCAH